MKINLSLICLFLGLFSFGQVSITNERLTDSTLNIFYIGVDNPIKLTSKKPDHLYRVIIQGSGSAITRVGPHSFIVRATTIGTCKVTVMEGSKQVLAKEYKVDTLGPAFASLNGFYNTTITKSKLLLNPFLKIVSPGSYYELNYKIVSFSIAFIKNGDSTVRTQRGHIFSKEQFEQSQQVKSGDELWIHDISVNDPDSRTTPMPSFRIKIE
jgi:hypothetical protein